MIAAVASAWVALNTGYQVVRKPSELLFPISGTLNKVPGQTWSQYRGWFEKYSTARISPELLAALAQVEGSGNPVVRTYWRWATGPGPFDVYRPASSSVGMYQMTDGTFALARHYCIRDHQVLEDGRWNDFHSCWFNGLYLRILPSHAVELTAAYLDHEVSSTLNRHHVKAVRGELGQELAAIIHLCGAGTADAFVRHGFQLLPEQRCGQTSAQDYVRKVNDAVRLFSQLRAATSAANPPRV